jgi:hypothetical protein
LNPAISVRFVVGNPKLGRVVSAVLATLRDQARNLTKKRAPGVCRPSFSGRASVPGNWMSKKTLLRSVVVPIRIAPSASPRPFLISLS